MPQIKKEVLDRIRKDQKLIYSISQGMGRSFRTVERWIRENSEMLASKAVVLILGHETGLTEDQIVEKKTVAAVTA